MNTTARSIIGKTVKGVISRTSASGGVTLVMLQFSDGSCFEFVSPAINRRLGRSDSMAIPTVQPPIPQLNMFPLDGETVAAAA